MTPKEKAKELYSKFEDSITGLDGDEWYNSAKQCALICVDAMEKTLTEYGEDSHELQNMDSYFRYLENVKQEIEKL